LPPKPDSNNTSTNHNNTTNEDDLETINIQKLMQKNDEEYDKEKLENIIL